MKKLKLMIVSLASLVLASCGSVDITLLPTATDGLCGVHKELDTKGNPYYIGACANESVLIQWTQDSVEWRAIRKKNGDVKFYMKNEKGVFEEIDAKAPNPEIPTPRQNNDQIFT